MTQSVHKKQTGGQAIRVKKLFYRKFKVENKGGQENVKHQRYYKEVEDKKQFKGDFKNEEEIFNFNGRNGINSYIQYNPLFCR